MPVGRLQKKNLRNAALGAALVALTSQIYISLFSGDFKISVAIVLLSVFAFLSPGFPVALSALLAAPGVFLLRILADWLSDGVFPNPWIAHAPELLFYLAYGLLLALYLQKVSLQPYRLVKFLPLIAIDALANFGELLVRMGTGVFEFPVLLRLVAVGLCRALLAAAILRALDYYGFRVLRREEADRYRRLLLLTSTLKSEVAWMNKGAALIENTMSAAYQLYSQLRRVGAEVQMTNAALTIAKDIHEVKKEYFLIIRGISEALESDTLQDGMYLGELFAIMETGVQHSAAETGKCVAFQSAMETNFYTKQHHVLMSVLHNLLGNAVEAAKHGVPVRLTLTQRCEGESCIFEVRDSCGGIQPEFLGQIFLPGFSSKLNRETGEINRGLGLCIVKDLVEEALGGGITVQSVDGGTIFTIRVPQTGLEAQPDAVLSD